MARATRTGEKSGAGQGGGARGETPAAMEGVMEGAVEAAAGAVRVDQIRCPRCGAFGCPRTGEAASRFGKTRYRKCSAKTCGHTFSTFEAFAPGSNSTLGGVERVRR